MPYITTKVKECMNWIDDHPRTGWYLFLITVLQTINLVLSTVNVLN